MPDEYLFQIFDYYFRKQLNSNFILFDKDRACAAHKKHFYLFSFFSETYNSRRGKLRRRAIVAWTIKLGDCDAMIARIKVVVHLSGRSSFWFVLSDLVNATTIYNRAKK